MKRLILGLTLAVGFLVIVPIVALGAFSIKEERNCRSEAEELSNVREVVAADLTGLHNSSLKLVSICDSGDSPYFSTDLPRSISPEQAVRHLAKKGWHMALTDHRPDGRIWSWEMRKECRAKYAYLSMEQRNAYDKVSITVSLL